MEDAKETAPPDAPNTELEDWEVLADPPSEGAGSQFGREAHKKN